MARTVSGAVCQDPGPADPLSAAVSGRMRSSLGSFHYDDTLRYREQMRIMTSPPAAAWERYLYVWQR